MTSRARITIKALGTSILMSLGSLAISFNQTAGASSIGSLDPTFGNAGVSTFNVGSSVERAPKLMVDSQGRLLVIGTSGDVLIMSRFLSTGAIDTSFSPNGFKVHHLGGPFVVSDAVLSQGKIVVVGYQINRDTGLAGLPSVGQFNEDGSFDAAFGIGGRFQLGFGGVSERFEAVAIQPDGKMVVVGTTNNHFLQQQTFLVVKLNSDGSRDSAFGSNGVTRIDVSSGVDIASSVRVLADSKILIAGTVNGVDLGVTRLNADGSTDLSFGSNGFSTRLNTGSSEVFSDMQIAEDEKIVVSSGCLVNNQATYLCVTRFNSDGSNDNSFATSGNMTLTLETKAQSTTRVAVFPEGKVLVAGTSDDDFVVTRLSAAGVVDTSFGSNGTTHFGIGTNSELFSSFEIDNQQRLLLAGTSDDDFVVTRLSAAGVIDSSFGSNGYKLSRIDRGEDYFDDAVQLPSGHFLVLVTSNDDLNVLRLNPNGSVDTSFGQSGKVVITRTSESREEGAKLITQADGRILVAGTTRTTINNEHVRDIIIVRLNRDGSIDNSFGNNGVLIHDLGARNDYVGDMKIDTTGRIVLGGGTGNNDGMVVQRDDFLLVRFLANGLLDTSFGVDGTHTTNLGNLDAVESVLIQDNGKILVGGLTNINVNYDVALLRLNEDGTPDLSFGANGKVVYDAGFEVDESLVDLLLDANGRIVITTVIQNDGFNSLVARFLPNGVIDTSFNNGGINIVDTGGIDWPSNIHLDRSGHFWVSGYTEINGDSSSTLFRLNANGVLDTSFGDNGILKVQKYRFSVHTIFDMFSIFVFGSVLVAGGLDIEVMKLVISQQLGLEVPPPTLVLPTPQSNISAVVKLPPAPSVPTNARATTRNNSVRLSWDIPTFNTSFVVRDSAGVVQCRTISNACNIQGLKNGRQYNFLLFSVNSAGVESETAAKITAVPGFQVKQSTIKAGRAINLSSILTTPSKGKKTWRVVSGRCSIRGNRLVAASKTGTCRVRLSTTKQGAFGAMSTTVRISIAR